MGLTQPTFLLTGFPSFPRTRWRIRQTTIAASDWPTIPADLFERLLNFESALTIQTSRIGKTRGNYASRIQILKLVLNTTLTQLGNDETVTMRCPLHISPKTGLISLNRSRPYLLEISHACYSAFVG